MGNARVVEQGASYFDEYIPNDLPVPRGTAYRAFLSMTTFPNDFFLLLFAYVKKMYYLCSEKHNQHQSIP